MTRRDPYSSGTSHRVSSALRNVFAALTFGLLLPAAAAAQDLGTIAASQALTAQAQIPSRVQAADLLEQAIVSAQPRDGWAEYQQGDTWLIENPSRSGDDRLFWLNAGPVPAQGRMISVRAGITPPVDGEQSIRAGAGLYWQDPQSGHACTLQILASKDAVLICYLPNGRATEVGRLRGIAALDGSDRLDVATRGTALVALVNGQEVGFLEGHPSAGGELALIAYERGRFSFSALSVSPLEASAETPAPPTAQPDTRRPEVSMGDGLQGPLPQFAGDKPTLAGVYQGISTSILLHEMGHALIGELKVPSTGPEEDAVDIYSALQMVEPTLYPAGDEKIDQANGLSAAYAALSWFYSGMINQSSGQDTPWQDEHTADLKRFRNMFCVMHGAHPALFDGLAKKISMEERTLARCADEFSKQNRAWRSILAPYTRVSSDNPEALLPAKAEGAPVETVFKPSRRQVGEFFRKTYAEAITARNAQIGATYALPRPLRITYQDCDQLNAWYAPQEGTITMCYEIIEHFAVMISDIEMGTKDGYDAGTAPGVPVAQSAPKQGQASPPAAAAAAMDELADMGVPTTLRLFPSPYRGPTPVENPKAQILTTGDLVDLIKQGTNAMLVDTRSTGDGQSLPGALSLTDLGADGSLSDGFQSRVAAALEQITKGDRAFAFIVFGSGPQDRAAYNAALRVGAAGFNAFWYRGGLEAWTANGLPLAPLE